MLLYLQNGASRLQQCRIDYPEIHAAEPADDDIPMFQSSQHKAKQMLKDQ